MHIPCVWCCAKYLSRLDYGARAHANTSLPLPLVIPELLKRQRTPADFARFLFNSKTLTSEWTSAKVPYGRSQWRTGERMKRRTEDDAEEEGSDKQVWAWNFIHNVCFTGRHKDSEMNISLVSISPTLHLLANSTPVVHAYGPVYNTTMHT